MAPDGVTPTLAKELGGAVRRRRRLLRLTQLQLAKLAGCGADFLYDLEAGKPTIQLGKLINMLPRPRPAAPARERHGRPGDRRGRRPGSAAVSRPGREIQVASVFRKGSLAGRISRTRQGSVFEYDSAYLAAPEAGGIAFHLPAARRRFETVGVNLHPFFAGLLPEGLRLASLVQRLKTSPDDLLSILIEAGPDCIGDVSVVAEGENPGPPAATVDLGRLDRSSLSRAVRGEPRRRRGPRPGARIAPRRAGEALRRGDLLSRPRHAGREPLRREARGLLPPEARAAGQGAARRKRGVLPPDGPGLRGRCGEGLGDP